METTKVRNLLKTLSGVMAVAVLVTGCGGSGGSDATSPSSSSSSAATKNVATVNGIPVPMATFTQFLQILMMRYRQMHPGESMPEAEQKRAQTMAVQEAVTQELLFQEAQSLHLTVPDEELNKQWDTFMARFKKPEDFQQFLTSTGKSAIEYREQVVRRGALIDKYVNQEVFQKIKMSQAELQDLYEQHKKIPPQVRASHIFFRVDPNMTPDQKAQLKTKMEEIKKRILAGEKFETLARDFSQDGSAQQGGDLGFITQLQVVKPFADAAFKLKIGEVSDVVESQYGLHLIKKTDEKPAHEATFDELKDRLTKELGMKKQQEAYEELVKRLVAKAKVEILVKQEPVPAAMQLGGGGGGQPPRPTPPPGAPGGDAYQGGPAPGVK